jgi:hypothetical protein
VRDYERIAIVEGGCDGPLVCLQSIHIGPANNDQHVHERDRGKVWAWRTPRDGEEELLAGPFDSTEDGLAWASKIVRPSIGLTHDAPPSRTRVMA